jgi:predicted acyl esterase
VRWPRFPVGFLTVALVAGACSGSSGKAAPPAGPHGAPAAFAAHGSVGQIWVTGAPPVTKAVLFGPRGRVASAMTDRAGSLILRNVDAGSGYRVEFDRTAGAVVTAPVTVTAMGDDPDPWSYTKQPLRDGYQYLTARDGTKLAITVHLPGPASKGPYPTVMEYSGYTPADPKSPQPSTLIAQLLGFATVGVNMRGTGCSGGAFQFFEPLQSTDGYDAIETIAAQPWVLGHRVGMVGLSYPGISQLFVAQTQPPHLAAIAPLSPIADTYRGTLYPGGIFNDGFAKAWAIDRRHDARPAPGGQPWANDRIAAGDATCKANQALHSLAPDPLAQAQAEPYYQPNSVVVDNSAQALPNFDSLAPMTFASRIEVPVFIAGSWQDEQTGSYWINMLGRLTKSALVRAVLLNGNHSEPFTPSVLVAWYEFLEFEIAHRIPRLPALVRGAAPGFFRTVFGPVPPLPPDRFTKYTNFDAAYAAWRREPPIEVLLENGAGCLDLAPGAPCPTASAHFTAWPPPSTHVDTYYHDTGGRLVSAPPNRTAAAAYRYTGDGQATTYSGSSDGIWLGTGGLSWKQSAPGTTLSYVSDPLAHSVLMAGTGRVDLQIAATAPDVDLQVTLSEVRSDGVEYYVQAGWLRASHRALDAGESGPLRAVATQRQRDAAPLPSGRSVDVALELFPFAHVFHAGSRIRITLGTPGGIRPLWKFEVLHYDHDVTVTVATGGVQPSKIALPLVGGVELPAALPPCPSLRGQPCRRYQASTN